MEYSQLNEHHINIKETMQVTNLVSYEYAYMFAKMTLVCMTQTGHQMDNSLKEIFFSWRSTNIQVHFYTYILSFCFLPIYTHIIFTFTPHGHLFPWSYLLVCYIDLCLCSNLCFCGFIFLTKISFRSATFIFQFC